MVKLKIKNIINYIKIKLFDNQNRFSYNFFNFFYKYLIIQKKISYELINNFRNLGFSTSSIIPVDEINDLKRSLDRCENKFENYKTTYNTNDLVNSKLINIYEKYFNKEIDLFSKYYNSEIKVTSVCVWKNHGYPISENKFQKFFSEDYHTDNYLCTYFKLFINLENVDEDKGPLHIIPKKDSRKFFNDANYINRSNYNNEFEGKYIFKNIGKIGESLFFSPSECLHRAGIPEPNKSRFMLCYILNAVPKIRSEKFGVDFRKFNIFKNDDLSKKLGKPNNFYDLTNLFAHFFLNKKNQ